MVDCQTVPQRLRIVIRTFAAGFRGALTRTINQYIEASGLAKNAKANGSSRVCMGAAWRNVRDNRDFDKVVEMVQEINTMGMVLQFPPILSYQWMLDPHDTDANWIGCYEKK